MRWKRIKFTLRLLLLGAPLLLLLSFYADPKVLHEILSRLQRYHQERPQEKIYLHFDKPFYAAGDSIWFKAYLVEASLHTLESQSRVIYAELVDSAHRVIQRRILPATNGLAHGDFFLKEDLHQGKYLVRAYTNYMKNAGEEFFFLKEFSVLNPAKDYTQLESSKIFDPDSIDLQFFPEGGNLVSTGKSNRLAFKAVSPDGNSFPAEGYITDEHDSIITSFKADHDGMGILSFIPESKKRYYAQIRKPYSIKRLYELPEVKSDGLTLLISKINKYVKVTVNTTSAFTDQDIHLVVQSRGKVYHAQSGIVKASAWFTYLPYDKLPHGISQITVFNHAGQPLAERLIYQNHHESIKLSVRTDTATYGARQPVIVYMDALYNNGTSAQGSFSITVYDDKLLKSPDEYPITIENYLSLTSDLAGNIKNPGYYFKDTLIATANHLDLLMMVQGWRRFTWQDVLDKNPTPQLYVKEKGIPIRGRVTKAWKDKLVENSNLKLLSMAGQATILKPDSMGNFYTDDLIFYDTIDLVARTEDAKGRRQPYKFRIKPLSFPSVNSSISPYSRFDASAYIKQQTEQRSLLKLSDITQLDVFVVTAKRTMEKRQVNPWGKVIDMRKKRYQYTTLFELLMDNVKGLVIKGEPPTVTARLNGKEPIFGGTGMMPWYELEAEDIDMIETTKTFGASKYPQDLINLMIKPEAYNKDIIGITNVKYAGFYKAREFYSPRYENQDNQTKIPDKRTTLYWEPMLETDQYGRAAVRFYTADVASRYRVVIEGITADGYPGTASVTFEVK